MDLDKDKVAPFDTAIPSETSVGRYSNDFTFPQGSNRNTHVLESYSVSNGQYLNNAVGSNSTNTSTTSIDNQPPKNHVNLDRVRTRNHSETMPSGQSKLDDVNNRRADGQVLNPDKLRPTTSALTTSMCSTIEPTDCSAFNSISKAVYKHYSHVEYVRSEAQLEKEAYLIGNIKYSRWYFLPAAFFFEAVCGTLYSCMTMQKIFRFKRFNVDFMLCCYSQEYFIYMYSILFS